MRNLPRNGKVTLLGEINDLDQAYYYIAYGEYTGYVPKSFVSNITASPAQTEETVYGNLEDNVDAIFRVTYIILGFGVICILVDFLLLRKKEKLGGRFMNYLSSNGVDPLRVYPIKSSDAIL